MYRDPRSSSSPLSPCKLAEPLCIYQELGSGRRAGHTRCRTRRLPNATARNISPYHGQDCDTANTTGWFACCSLPERSPLAGTEKPAPQGNLEMQARRADASSFMPYFAAAWRRAMLTLMHGTMPTARTPTIAVTQAAKSLKCRAGIPMSRPTT